MNPQTRKVAPKSNATRKLSSGFGLRLPIRGSSRVSKRLLQGALSKRLLAEETKILQSHFDDILENCTTNAHADLVKFLESKVNLNEIWQNAYGIHWEPTEENLKTLSYNFLQSCKLFIRAESIDRPDPAKVMRRFAVSVVTDICEFLSVVNVGVCFYWNVIGREERRLELSKRCDTKREIDRNGEIDTKREIDTKGEIDTNREMDGCSDDQKYEHQHSGDHLVQNSKSLKQDIRCPHCGQGFESITELSSHYRKTHSREFRRLQRALDKSNKNGHGNYRGSKRSDGKSDNSDPPSGYHSKLKDRIRAYRESYEELKYLIRNDENHDGLQQQVNQKKNKRKAKGQTGPTGQSGQTGQTGQTGGRSSCDIPEHNAKEKAWYKYLKPKPVGQSESSISSENDRTEYFLRSVNVKTVCAGMGKNTADAKLIRDCRRWIKKRDSTQRGVLCIVSADIDFLPLLELAHKQKNLRTLVVTDLIHSQLALTADHRREFSPLFNCGPETMYGSFVREQKKN
eukprot:g2419.t1